jgi:hypothetical protein
LLRIGNQDLKNISLSKVTIEEKKSDLMKCSLVTPRKLTMISGRGLVVTPEEEFVAAAFVTSGSCGLDSRSIEAERLQQQGVFVDLSLCDASDDDG